MRINTNVASLQAQEAAKNTARNQSSSLEKLGTGLNINKASDDGAGLAIADKLRTQASSINQSLSNANSASALVNIADKAMSEQSNILDIVKTKLVQAATDTTTDDGREAIRKDITKLLEQFDNIASQTNYNGTTLLQKGEANTAKQDTLSFQIGEEASYDIELTQSKASNTASLGGGSDTVATGTNLKNDGASQQVKSDAAISIKDTNVSSTGDTAGTEKLDVTLAGKLGTLKVSTTGSVATLDASNESQSIKDALSAIAKAVSTTVFEDKGSGVFELKAGKSIDLGTLDFSKLNVKLAAANDGIILNSGAVAGTVVNITNNNADDAKKGLVDIAGTGMTGGNLLSDIKNLDSDELTATKANEFMNTIDEALTQLNANRADFGSAQNQIESSIRNLETTFTNIKAAESVIRDVDYAKESASFNKQNIIAQAGTYAMSQANAMQQNVSRLLQ